MAGVRKRWRQRGQAVGWAVQRCGAERVQHHPADERVGGQPAVTHLRAGQTDWTATLTAPSSRAESGGLTVWSLSVHTDSQAGGVGTGVASPASRSLPGASCRQAAGQAPGTGRAEPRRSGHRGAASRA